MKFVWELLFATVLLLPCLKGWQLAFNAENTGSPYEALEIYDRGDRDSYSPISRAKRAIITPNASSIVADLSLLSTSTLLTTTQAAVFVIVMNMQGILVENNDTVLEIFTTDLNTNASDLNICDVSIVEVQPGLVLASSPVVQKNYNLLDPKVVDRVVVSLAGLYAATPSFSCANCNVTIKFCVTPKNVLVVPTATSVNVGIAYLNSSYILIGQTKFNYSLPSTSAPASYSNSLNGTMQGPASIAQGDFGLYQADIAINLNSPTAVFNVLTINEIEDIFSIGNVRVNSTGYSYKCLNYLLNPLALVSYSPSTTDNTIYNANYTFQGLINYGATDVLNEDDIITMHFGIYVPEDVPVNTVLNISAEAILDSSILWTGILNVTVTPFTVQPLSNAVDILAAPLTSTTIPPSGSATFNVTVTFPASSYVTFVVKATAQSSVAVPCQLYVVRRGFNIHYLRPVNKVFSSDNSTMTVDFGRISVGNHSPNSSDYQVELEVSFKGSATGTTTVQFEVAGQTATSAITVTSAVSPGTVTPTVGNYSYTTLLAGGATAFNLNFLLTSGIPLNDLKVELYGDPAVVDAGVRICRAEVSFAGKALPCIEDLVADSSSVTTYSNNNPDFEPWFTTNALVTLGTICAAQRTVGVNSTYDSLLSFNVAVFTPRTNPLGSSFTMYARVTQGGTAVTTIPIPLSITSITTSLTPYVAFSNLQLDGLITNVTVFDSMLGDLPLGKVGLVITTFKVPPNLRASLSLTLMPSSGLQLCNVRIIFVGHNLPCTDNSPYGRWWYGASNYISFVNNTANLDFNFITNLGKYPLIQNIQLDDNTIVLAVFVKGVAIGLQNVSMVYTKSINVVPAAAPQLASATMGPVYNILKPTDGTTVHRGIVQLFGHNVSLSGGDLLSNITVSVMSSDAVLEIFTVAVTNVGDNFPCLNASQTKITNLVNSTTSGFYTQYEISFDACKYAYSDSTQADTFTVEIALRATPWSSSTSSSYQVTISGAPLSVTVQQTTTLQIDNNPISQTDQKTYFYKTSSVKPIMKVGEKAWLTLGIRIPNTAVTSFTINVSSALQTDGRSRIVFTGMRINRTITGNNIALGDFSPLTDIAYNSQPTGRIDEPSIGSLKIFNVTNTGITARQTYYNTGDDALYLDFECLVTDQSLNVVNGTIPVIANLINPGNNSITATANVNVTIARNANRNLERALITADLQLVNPSNPYKEGDSVDLIVSVQHNPNVSRAEALNARIRIFKPNYLVHIQNISSLSCNATCSVDTTNNLYVDVLINEILFLATISVNISLAVDPYSVRQGGSGTSLISLTSRVVCNQQPFASFPSSASTYLYCGDISQVTLQVADKDCWGSLGMDASSSTQLDDCQITGSSALSTSTLPKYGRLGGDKVWVPQYRDGAEWAEPYLQVNFGTFVNIAGVFVEAVPGYRSASFIRIDTSNDGTSFLPAGQGYLNSTMRELRLPKTVKARIARLVVLGSEDYSNTNSAYLGIRMDWMGCNSPSSSNAAAAPVAACSADTAENPLDILHVKYLRHFIVDPITSYAYVCDYRPYKRENKCFVTPNGLLWKALPSYIGYLLGYDSEKELILAMDKSDSVCLAASTDDSWVYMPMDECSTTSQQATFTRSVPVPGSSSTELTPLKLNGWTADFWGFKPDISSSYSLRWA